jgi:hypothetical protein
LSLLSLHESTSDKFRKSEDYFKAALIIVEHAKETLGGRNKKSQQQYCAQNRMGGNDMGVNKRHQANYVYSSRVENAVQKLGSWEEINKHSVKIIVAS